MNINYLIFRNVILIIFIFTAMIVRCLCVIIFILRSVRNVILVIICLSKVIVVYYYYDKYYLYFTIYLYINTKFVFITNFY